MNQLDEAVNIYDVCSVGNRRPDFLEPGLPKLNKGIVCAGQPDDQPAARPQAGKQAGEGGPQNRNVVQDVVGQHQAKARGQSFGKIRTGLQWMTGKALQALDGL
ncbi:MAG: hypothetical protein KDD06_23165 [Phaeodactylibacter sp.]|nr:hypothetical protein [Phaeodactylibacter sp.]